MYHDEKSISAYSTHFAYRDKFSTQELRELEKLRNKSF